MKRNNGAKAKAKWEWGGQPARLVAPHITLNEAEAQKRWGGNWPVQALHLQGWAS